MQFQFMEVLRYRYRKVWKGHGGTSGEAFNMIFTLSMNKHPLSTIKLNITLLKY